MIVCNDKGVTFKWKDYRLEGRERYQVMTLATHEFIRRFLMHVLPAGFGEAVHAENDATVRIDNFTFAPGRLTLKSEQRLGCPYRSCAQ